MTRDGERLLGHLTHQPSAGKVEYMEEGADPSEAIGHG